MITHRPPVQGTPEQQSLLCVHVWPYCAQGGPESGVPGASVVPGASGAPASGGGGGGGVTGGLQVPVVAPGGMLHDVPTQQSAVVVHAPPDEMHRPAPHTKGGEPAGLGTHGLSQQSALDAHAVPAGGAPASLQSRSDAAVQRGMPSRSCWQLRGCVCTVPAQQRSVALQDVTASRQMAPAGLHAWPLSQRPIAAPAALLQCTFVIAPPLTFVEPGAPGAPQQSLSF
jgi:hypothetical protein